jgi:hypothetical protein
MLTSGSTVSNTDSCDIDMRTPQVVGVGPTLPRATGACSAVALVASVVLAIIVSAVFTLAGRRRHLDPGGA